MLRRALSTATLPVDHARYPLTRPDSPRMRAVVQRGREALVATGLATFPHFLAPGALAAAAAEARDKAPAAFVCEDAHNAYQAAEADPSLPPSHVRNVSVRSTMASTAGDELSGGHPLVALHGSEHFLAFVRGVTGRRLFPLADRLGGCSINVVLPGMEGLAWHFDESEFSTTLCLQGSDRGGHFEFTPPLRRSKGDLAAAAVAAVVNEHSEYSVGTGAGPVCCPVPAPPVERARFEEGTLQIFAGAYSLHRVTAVPPTARRARLSAVLCFASAPGVCNSPAVQQMFWGRTAEG